MDIQIRNIETAAYSAVLRAFNAQSEVLTWEKEGLMSELRKELRVSDVEHRETLLKINTDDSIKMIRELRKGGNSQKEMSANATSHASHKRFKVSHVVVSSSPKYPTPSQPSSAAIHSSLATQFKGAQSYSEGAIVSIKENTKESAKSVGHNRRESDTTKGMRSLQLKSNSVVQFSDAIEIRATDKLIHEIEKVICGEEIPKLAQVEKAKSILKPSKGRKQFCIAFHYGSVRIIAAVSFLDIVRSDLILLSKTPSNISTSPSSGATNDPNGASDSCTQLHSYHDYEGKCAYIGLDEGCRSEGYIDYLWIFYCTCGRFPTVGYIVLVAWVIVLFYLLGNTAADYFCSSLENLSRVLKLSPTIAGVTLLSLGNGATDVFSSIVSFMDAGAGDVGLNSVLGGAFVVSCIVVGVISISISPRRISVDKSSFIRDVLFLILSLCSLLVIVRVGTINIWGAIAFVSLYFVYVFFVYISHFLEKKGRAASLFAIQPILPLVVSRTLFGCESEEYVALGAPLLDFVHDEKPVINGEKLERCCCFRRFLRILELPLYLPRRLTIPVVSEERWSKPFAVISTISAPVLLATLWNSQKDIVGCPKTSLMIYLISGCIGVILGIAAFVSTKSSCPPKRFLLPWLIGGFLMSITWTYIIAEELVALLVSIGRIFEIRASILGLTLLAWGNSLGDLIANVAMSMNGDHPGGVQVAISGCYAGPIFNTIIGLGLSLGCAAWSEYPKAYVIPKDPFLYETLGFMICGLLWALVILPRRKMVLDKILGVGLLVIYLCFLSVRLAQTLDLGFS
ncbi:hypothetical protein GIB67_010030 [Kingdonia uniflora]|uniref:ENT domain-containing protein n=1 Tax=Kingdonia uniflora TaxID=39325 RepID=A0A7J7KV52_9MAGN|nr:hypothetical protein GIB67_010030 [Kingdonia uniflora]